MDIFGGPLSLSISLYLSLSLLPTKIQELEIFKYKKE